MVIVGMDYFQNKCKKKLVEWYNNKAHNEYPMNLPIIDESHVFVVWACKSLKNYKALLSTRVKDGIYVEFTYNGDEEELYMDVYKKLENKCFEE